MAERFNPGNPPPGWKPPADWRPIEEHREIYPAQWTEGREGRPLAEEPRLTPLAGNPLPRPEDAPNYERLTGAEQWLMNRLPGFSQSGVGRALAWVGSTWAGKALNVLDIEIGRAHV